MNVIVVGVQEGIWVENLTPVYHYFQDIHNWIVMIFPVNTSITEYLLEAAKSPELYGHLSIRGTTGVHD